MKCLSVTRNRLLALVVVVTALLLVSGSLTGEQLVLLLREVSGR